jgi:hypothetical protein
MKPVRSSAFLYRWRVANHHLTRLYIKRDLPAMARPRFHSLEYRPCPR